MIVDMSKCTWDKKDVTINLNWYTKWHNASKTYKCFIGSGSYMKHIKFECLCGGLTYLNPLS